jgi:hypothetical protein
MRKPPGYIANFDSATAMLRATSRFLKGKDFPALGLGAAMKPPIAPVNRVPRLGREVLYAGGAANESIRPSAVGRVSGEKVARWMTSQYPKRRYPGAFIGSSSGALVHLAAAMGMPWLPQTFMIPVRQPDVHPDDARAGMEAGRKPGRKLLDNNPELQLHHMHDPNQDRLPLFGMTYFRVKWRQLARAYREFLIETVPEGGTIFLVECTRTWPTTALGDRHLFQFGALGGAREDEFFEGSERVEEFLDHYKSDWTRWDPPAPNGLRPEAEWGFEPALRDTVFQLAEARGWKVRRLVFEEPEHLSPLVADLHRWWYRQRGIRTNRLLIGSFLVQEPYWALRTGSVPFWMKFNMEPSAEWLEAYLKEREPFDELRLMLFAHGVDAVGLPPIERWRSILAMAKGSGEFVGVDETEYPRDFATYARYHDQVKKIPSRYAIPGPLTIGQLDRFLDDHGDASPVAWHEAA